jgi:hypothetical protein
MLEAIPTNIPFGKQAGTNGLIKVASRSDVQRAQDMVSAAAAAQNSPEIVGLAAWLRRAWESARRAKQPIQNRLHESLRQRRGEYDPDKLQAIKNQGGSEVYMLVTDTKCTAALSWIRDVLFQPGEKPWGVVPTPIPDLPLDIEIAMRQRVTAEFVMMSQSGVPLGVEDLYAASDMLEEAVKLELFEEARKRAQKMEQKIEDQFVEGGYYQALEEALDDIVTFDNGFIVGPELHEVTELDWSNETGTWMPKIVQKVKPNWYRVSPFDVYPAGDSRGINDGHLFIRVDMRRSQLLKYKKVPGFNPQAIDAVLMEHGMNGLKDWLWDSQTRATAEDRNLERESQDRTLECLRFWGSIQGKLLREQGMDPRLVTDIEAEYEVEAWMIGRYVVRLVLNRDPLGRRPIYTSSFEKVPGSFWGKSPPRKMRDSQTMCNASARALVNNMGIASGPQVEVFEDRLAEGEDIESMYPWRIWQTKSDPTGGGHRAIQFHNVPMVAAEMMGIFEFFSKQAEDQTGIPAYVHGNASVGGGGRTASGLSMLMSSAAKGIKQVIKNLDDGLLAPSVERMYQFNMARDPDQSIKGDLEVRARGSEALLAKEQLQIRRQEYLAATNNPIDYAIMGPEGRATLLREGARGLDLPVDRVVPDPERQRQLLLRRVAASMMGPEAHAGAPGSPAVGHAPPQAPTAVNEAGDKVSGQDANAFPNRRQA